MALSWFDMAQGLIQYGTAALVLPWLIWRKSDLSRRQVLVIGTAWAVLGACLYWILGDRSFLLTEQEMDYSFPLHALLGRLPAGTMFDHAFAGGNDTHAMAAVAGQYVSLERLLIAWLPLWAANGLHKTMVAAVAVAGGYLLGRRGLGAGRAAALGAALLASRAHEYLTYASWAQGLGYALIPLVVLAVSHRQNRPGYFLQVAGLGCLYATSCLPTHHLMALFAVLACAPLVLERVNVPRAALAMGLFLIPVVVNWSETITGMAGLAPYTLRGSGITGASRTALWDVLMVVLADAKPIVLVMAAAALHVVLGRRDIILRVAGCLGLFLAIPTLLGLIPWKTVFPPLTSLNFAYTLEGLPAVFIMVWGLISRPGPQGSGERPRRHLAAAGLALAAGMLAWSKPYELAVWLTQGGLTALDARGLEDRSWLGGQPVRAIAFPYRMVSNQLPVWGLESYDGSFNLLPLPYGRYWSQILRGLPLEGLRSGYASLETHVAFECCQPAALDTMVDVDLLRIANVGFVLSRYPLSGSVTQVAGPQTPLAAPIPGQGALSKLRSYVAMIKDPPPIRVYAISDPRPRVYAAQSLETVRRDLPDTELAARIKAAPARGVVVAADQAATLADFDPDARIEARLVPNGFRVDLAGGKPALVVFNIAWTPFWTARAGGRDLPVVPVNMAQMAVRVPAGATVLEMDYTRPLLRHRLGF